MPKTRHNSPIPKNLLHFSRQLRQDPTDAEKKLWRLLHSRQLEGIKFRRQFVVGPYILDFYCHTARLAVELDGSQHGDEEKLAKDQRRTEHLAKTGIRVIRFNNDDVLKVPNVAVDTIVAELKSDESCRK